MDEWRLDPLVARVVDWHNRHPLARRITPQHVHSLGFVALPHALSMTAAPADAPDDSPAPVASTAANPTVPAGSLRERARLRAQEPMADVAAPAAAAVAAHLLPGDESRDRRRGSALRAAFSEDFIAPLSPLRVARWAARHARESASAPAGGPLRQVTVDSTSLAPGDRPVMLYAMTAAVEASGMRTRLLVSADARAPVLGRRLWSRPRVAAATGGVVAALSLLAATPGYGPAESATAQPAAVAAAAHASGAASAAVVATVALVAHAGGPVEGALPVHGASPDIEPHLGRIELPPPVPAIDEAARAAARQARRPRLPPPDAAQTPSSLPVAALPVDAPARTPAGTTAAVPAEASWALTTRLLRTRAESQQLRRAIDELLREQGNKNVRVEMLPVGDDWRVVGWPFTRRAEAERARDLLVARGLRVEVMDF